MLIGEFAKKVNTTPDTIRFYEKVGFFSNARCENGYRLYTDSDVELANFISCGKRIGFTLREILVFSKEMTNGSVSQARVRRNLEEKMELIDSQIAALKKMKKLIQIKYQTLLSVKRS